ncbi:nonstructural protein [Chifec microvirus UA13_18]|nr:nonstructural protein [Chifec microvirus UA13_18]
MKQKCFAIYDVKAESYGIPFFAATNGLAVRSFMQLCEDSNSMVFKYPEDFTLYCIGEIDLFNGDFVLTAKPVYILNGATALNVADAGAPAEASPRD